MSESSTEQVMFPPTKPAKSPFAKWALTIALLTLAVAAWQWLDQRHKTNKLEQTLAKRLSAFDDRNRESQLLARRADESVMQASAKISLLEQKLEESRNQQESLQTLYLELANNRDEWAISEVEQLLIIASQQLQLASNVKSALLALQTADSRLQQIDKPQVIQLRKVIGNDIQRLQALPSVDIVGMSLKLDALADAAGKLPLIGERHPKQEQPTMPDWDASPWHRLAQEIWQDIKRLVRIERIDHPEVPLLGPEQSYFLRENLKLRLLAARIALLQHDESTYRNDLHTAESWIKQHFAVQESATQNALTILQQLLSSDISIQLPDISATLNAISKYKLALERSAQ